MEKIKTRDEVDSKYKWDLSTIYNSDNEVESDIKKLKEKVDELLKYKGHLLDSSDTLYTSTKTYYDLSRIMERLYVYANLKLHEDMAVSKNQVLVGKLDMLFNEISSSLAFYTPEILKGDYNLVKKYISENEQLKKYSFMFENLFRSKEHALSEKEEVLLSNLGEVLSAPLDTFEVLDDVDMSFDKIKDENGKSVELNSSNYNRFLKSTSRKVRRDAFNKFYKGYEKFKNTYANILKSEVKTNSFLAKSRNYNSVLEMSLFNDNIDKKLYDKLIKEVNDSLDDMHKYIALRKKVLNLPNLHMYDLYVSMVDEPKLSYTYEEAKEIILKALEPLGETYINDLKHVLESNCIDVFNNKNKMSGAYSWGAYDTNPFILMNFEGTYYDVETLIHELGHSMHSFYSHKYQEYQDSEYTIFLAEIASTVNEMLLNRYMYNNSKTKNEKLFYLNNLLDMFRTTLYRQTMFAEFEKIIYEKEANKEVLNEELLSGIYYDLNKKYYGKSLVHDSLIRLEWARISHFYKGFYVYKYATGISIAASIVTDILNNKENALNNYLEFLKSGGKTYSLEILKNIGIDIENDDTIKKALQMYKDTLEEFISELEVKE